MRLNRAARKGDTVDAVDAYGGEIFKVQYDPLSYSKIDGVSIKKRAISVAPSVVMPVSGVITINGENYLVGLGAPDFWNGEVIRLNYVIQGVTGLAKITSFADELAGVTAPSAYAALVFSKYMPDSMDNSKYPPQYQVFLSGAEDAPSDSLIWLADKWFLVKQSYLSTSGLRVALANELDEPTFDTVTYNSQTYDPLTDSYTTVSTTVKILRVKWSEHFTYLSLGSEQYQRGDMQVILLKSTSAKPSDTITLSDGVWRVMAAQDEGLVWSCHVRRA